MRVARFASVRLSAFMAGVLLAGCGTGDRPTGWTLLETRPHDPGAYTQGLVYHNGELLESTGLYGQSTLRRVEPETGTVIQGLALAPERFGEGLARLGDRLYQVTWQSQVGYVYDLASFQVVDSFSYTGEGWGLASDGTHLILSDGSATLRFLDPSTWQVVREVEVRDGNSPVRQLNELEWVQGHLFANVYQTNWVVRIDPATGAILQWLDFTSLVPPDKRGSDADVLNGIAWDAATNRFFITGKRWSRMYVVQIDPRR